MKIIKSNHFNLFFSFHLNEYFFSSWENWFPLSVEKKEEEEKRRKRKREEEKRKKEEKEKKKKEKKEEKRKKREGNSCFLRVSFFGCTVEMV